MSADGVVGRIHNDGDFTQLRTQLVTPPRPGTARAEAERIGSTDTVDQISACGTNRLQPELLSLCATIARCKSSQRRAHPARLPWESPQASSHCVPGLPHHAIRRKLAAVP